MLKIESEDVDTTTVVWFAEDPAAICTADFISRR